MRLFRETREQLHDTAQDLSVASQEFSAVMKSLTVALGLVAAVAAVALVTAVVLLITQGKRTHDQH